MSLTDTRVAILGAGLTGMSAAHHLRLRGVAHRIVERSAHAGGHAVTIEDDGYRFDRTGHLLHLRDPEMRKLVLGWLGEDIVKVQRHSMVWTNGRYTRYPFQANTYGLPPEVAYACVMGFLEAQADDDPREPVNFEQFCYRRFGAGFSDHFMIPYNCRLWGVHPREITAAWCSRFVPLPKLEDVIAGAVGLNDRELGYNTEFVYPRRGIGALTDAMAKTLPHIEYNKAPFRIDVMRKELHFEDGEAVRYEHLISTAPLDTMVAVLDGVPDEVRQAATKLRCTALYYLDAALDAPVGKPYHWVYVPESRYPFYRVGCYSNFSPEMAPPGKSCLYIELADRAEPDMGQLVPQVANDLVELGLIERPSQLAFARLRKMEHAYVIFDHDYFASVETIQRYLQNHHIVSTGRYGGWNYSSMEDALLFGRDAANQITKDPR